MELKNKNQKPSECKPTQHDFMQVEYCNDTPQYNANQISGFQGFNGRTTRYIKMVCRKCGKTFPLP